ncbi:MAG: hypothetical protein FWF28_02180 [Micrococcales bacterium]|nr:hypothetical protein [Micrococcales bacterium]
MPDERRLAALKTARLRGTYSQGIVFALGDFPELAAVTNADNIDATLGIRTHEPPLPNGMAALGKFPGFLVKSDAERVQNLDNATWAQIRATHDEWLPTEKVDGTSLTAWVTADGVLHAVGRHHPPAAPPELARLD